VRQESPYRSPGHVILTGVAFVKHKMPAIVLGWCAPPRVLCGQAARSPDVPPVRSVLPLPSIHIPSHCVIDRWGTYAESCFILCAVMCLRQNFILLPIIRRLTFFVNVAKYLYSTVNVD
jgi:hypothetical protein